MACREMGMPLSSLQNELLSDGAAERSSIWLLSHLLVRSLSLTQNENDTFQFNFRLHVMKWTKMFAEGQFRIQSLPSCNRTVARVEKHCVYIHCRGKTCLKMMFSRTSLGLAPDSLSLTLFRYPLDVPSTSQSRHRDDQPFKPMNNLEQPINLICMFWTVRGNPHGLGDVYCTEMYPYQLRDQTQDFPALRQQG